MVLFMLQAKTNRRFLTINWVPMMRVNILNTPQLRTVIKMLIFNNFNDEYNEYLKKIGNE